MLGDVAAGLASRSLRRMRPKRLLAAARLIRTFEDEVGGDPGDHHGGGLAYDAVELGKPDISGGCGT
jgi:hypothetical protein